MPFGTRGGTVFQYNFPRDGEYNFHIELSRARSGTGIVGLDRLQQLEVAIDGERVKLFEFAPAVGGGGQGNAGDDPPESEADAGLKVRVPVKAGRHTILATFLKPPATLVNPREPLLADSFGASNRVGAAIFSVAVSGPFGTNSGGETLSRQRIFVCRPARPTEEAACAKTIVSSLARRAYRRNVTSDEVDDLLTFYKEERAAGGGFEAGIELAVRALVVKPQFLFRIERAPNAGRSGVYRISDVELASRLSFFLWSSIPDDALLDAAIRGRLKDPMILRDQVRRMLADPRSDALVKSFANQWLYLSNLASATPDNNLFDFDDNLRQAMRQETELFFSSVKAETWWTC